MSKVLAVLIILFPLSLQKVDFRSRFTAGLTIELNKTSPAYAALEDLRQNFITPNVQTPADVPAMRLASGQSFSNNVDQLVGARRISLAAIRIRKFRRNPPSLAQVHERFSRSPSMRDDHGDLLPLRERKQVLAEYLSGKDWSPPTVRDAAQKLITEELQTATPNPTSKVIVGTGGHRIYIAKAAIPSPSVVRHGSVPVPSRPEIDADSPASHPSIVVADNESKRPSMSEGFMPVSSTAYVAGQRTIYETQESPSQRQPYLLKGQLRVTHGLAFIGSNASYFRIYRARDGRAMESGHVWVSQARFEIQVDEGTGELIAELRNRDGRILGRGELDLSNVLKKKRGYTISGLDIDLHPVVSGAGVHLVSGYSVGARKTAMVHAKANFEGDPEIYAATEDGHIRDADRTPGSTYIVSAQSEHGWPTVSVGAEGVEQDVRIYSDKFVKALLDLTTQGQDRKDAEEQAVVWGRILKKGRPVAGVKVEMAGAYAPIYFDKVFIPEQKAEATSANGLFAFVGVRPGVQSVRVKYQGKVYPAQIFPARAHQVSYMDLAVDDIQKVRLTLEDAFDPAREVQAQVRFLGVDQEIAITNEAELKYPSLGKFVLVEADAGPGYELARTEITKKTHVADIPLLKKNWVNSILADKKINLMPNRGALAGFVSDRPFQVSITGETPYFPPTIVYFDQQGRVVKGDTGPSGGGFMIFNAPVGAQTLLIRPLNSDRTYSQVVVAEPRYIDVFKYSFATQD